MKVKKIAALLLAVVVAIGSCFSSASALTTRKGWVDGEYSGTSRIADENYSYGIYDVYSITADLSIEDGRITDLRIDTDDDEINDGGNEIYIEDAIFGYGSDMGVSEQLLSITSPEDLKNIDAVTGATYTSEAIVEAVKEALADAWDEGEPVDPPEPPEPDLPNRPEILISPEKAFYANDELVEVTLISDSAGDASGIDVYYTLDYSYNAGSNLANPADEAEDRYTYSKPFTVNIGDTEGGTVFLQAVSYLEGAGYSETSKVDLHFQKVDEGVIEEGIFSVNGIYYEEFAEAVAAIDKNYGGTLRIHSDIILSAEELQRGMPEEDCIITSAVKADGSRHMITGTQAPMVARGNLSFEHINYNIDNLYADGYSIIIGEGIDTGDRFSDFNIFAGCPYVPGSYNDSYGDVEISAASGSFNLYASGAENTILYGDITITAGQDAWVNLYGAAEGAVVTRSVEAEVYGDNVRFDSFIGELAGGLINGKLTLNIYGTPIVTQEGLYQGSYNKEAFGKVTLQDSILNPDLFTGFAEVSGGSGNEPEPGAGGWSDGRYFGSAEIGDPNYSYGIYDIYTVFADVQITGGKITELAVTTDDDEINRGGNASYIEDAIDGYSGNPGIRTQMIGLTSPDAFTDIDAVTGATYTSQTITAAVKDALADAWTGGELPPEQPLIKAHDQRTRLIYGAESQALIAVAGEEGCDLYYTIDGNIPNINDESGSTRTVEDGLITLSAADAARDTQVNLQVVAARNGLTSTAAEAMVMFVGSDPQGMGSKTYLGRATCTYGDASNHYDVIVRVTTVNGYITQIEDAGTIPTMANAVYADGAFRGMAQRDGAKTVIGKRKSDVPELQTVAGSDAELKADAVSGATVVSDALKYAVVDALSADPVFISGAQVGKPDLIQIDSQPDKRADQKLWVLPNIKGYDLRTSVQAQEGTLLYYTTDGSAPDENSSFLSNGETLYFAADPEMYPEGQQIQLQVVAVKGGNISEIREQKIMFVNLPASGSFENGTYFRSSNPGNDVDAEVIISGGVVSRITVYGYDHLSEEELRKVVPELTDRMLWAQSADVETVSGAEEASPKIIEAVAFHLQAAYTDQRDHADTPVITVSPQKTTYDNGEEVTITLKTDTPEADIYYTVDYSHSVGSHLSDPTDESEGTLRHTYMEPFTVNIGNTEGGNVYIRAAAYREDLQYSDTSRVDLNFLKAVGSGAISVNGEYYSSFSDAVTAIDRRGGGTLMLHQDIQLSSDELQNGMPVEDCLITSEEKAGGGYYQITGTAAPMRAKGNLSFDNIAYNINNLYADGYTVVIGENVTTGFSFMGFNIYAGSPYEAVGENDSYGDVEISVSSGSFNLYGSGAGSTMLYGDIKIVAQGTAAVKIYGAAMNARVSRTMNVEIHGDSVSFDAFSGELSGGEIQKDLWLKIFGTPAVASWNPSYQGSVNKDSFGRVSLYQSQLDPELFTKFAEILVEN